MFSFFFFFFFRCVVHVNRQTATRAPPSFPTEPNLPLLCYWLGCQDLPTTAVSTELSSSWLLFSCCSCPNERDHQRKCKVAFLWGGEGDEARSARAPRSSQRGFDDGGDWIMKPVEAVGGEKNNDGVQLAGQRKKILVIVFVFISPFFSRHLLSVTLYTSSVIETFKQSSSQACRQLMVQCPGSHL